MSKIVSLELRNECAKSRAKRAGVPTCPRALRAYVPEYITSLRALWYYTDQIRRDNLVTI